MTKAAEKAAISVNRDFGELERLQVSRKGTKNFVTNTDRFAEQKIQRMLSQARPNFSFLCEESGETKNSDTNDVFIIDPIDGTTNFMRGVPYFAINIALMKNGEITSCVTFDPLRSEYFCADKGQGAFVGVRKRLRVSGNGDLRDSVVAFRMPLNKISEKFERLAILRRTGSTALDLAYLAAGKYDAVIAQDVQLWDIASGILLIKEAGGFLEYSKNEDGRYTIFAAASSRLLSQIQSFFKKKTEH